MVFKKYIALLVFFLFTFYNSAQANELLSVVINEIAWMGRESGSTHEWIELYNNTDKDIELGEWSLYEQGGMVLIEPLDGVIRARDYYLIERTSDLAIPDISASQKPSGWGGYGLKNSGEYLQLLNQNFVIIDEVNCSAGWFAGDNKTKQTMERKNPSILGSEPKNWQTSQSPGGTPKAKNSLVLNLEPKNSEIAAFGPEIENAKKLTAAIKEQVGKPQKPFYFYSFLISLGIAVLSGIIFLCLKRKFKPENLR